MNEVLVAPALASSNSSNCSALETLMAVTVNTYTDYHSRSFAQVISFNPPLVQFKDIFVALTFWNTIGFAFIFFACGVVAACVFRKHWVALALPIVAGAIGSLFGVFLGILLCLSLSFHSSSLHHRFG